VIDSTKTRGFFDDACQEIPGLCGARAAVFLSNHHCFSSNMELALALITEMSSLHFEFC
jgi:hypothetical protein